MATTPDPGPRAWRADAAAVCALLLVVCAFWWRILFMRAYLVLDDMARQNVPLALLYARALADGRVPLWVSDLGGGYPLLAESQVGALYPPNLILFALLPPLAALNLSGVLHAALAAVGAYACARRFGVSPAAALLAGVAFGLSGLMSVHAIHVNMIRAIAWLPLLILCVDGAAASRRPWRWAPAVALVTAMQWLAAYHHITLLSIAGAIWYAVFAAGAQGRAAFWHRARSLWPAVAGGLLLGVLLAAAQLLPSLELVAFSERAAAAGLRQSTYGLMPARHLLALLLPTLFGSPKTNTFAGATWQFHEWCGYLSAVALMMAAAALLCRRDWRVWCLGSLAAASLVVAVTPQVQGLLSRVPVLSGVRVPPRALLLFTLSAALLAAMGADAAPRRSRLARGLAGCLALLLAAVGGAALLLRARTGYAAGAELWLTVGVLAGVWLALRLAPRWAAGALLAALAAAQLYQFGYAYQPLVGASFYTQPPPVGRQVPDPVLESRVYSTHHLTSPAWQNLLAARGDWSRDHRIFEAERDALSHNWPACFGLRSLRLYCGLPLLRYSVLLRALAEAAPDAHASVWGAANTRHLITSRYFGAGSPSERLDEAGVPTPRARIVRRPVRCRDAYEALDLMLSRLDPTQEAAVEAPPSAPLPASGQPTDGSIRIVSETPTRLVVEAHSARPALLALADAYCPGWHATVNGREAQIWPTDVMFRGVVVPGGDSQVVFEYRPVAVRVGLFAGLAALALLCGVLACRALRREPAGSGS